VKLLGVGTNVIGISLLSKAKMSTNVGKFFLIYKTEIEGLSFSCDTWTWINIYLLELA